MAEIESEIFFYRDDKDRLRRTKSGHYRFDMILRRPDGQPYFAVRGLRFDLAQKRILPVTVPAPKGGVSFTVAEVAPEEHANLANWLTEAIEQALEKERVGA